MYIFLGELSFTSTNNQKTISPIIGDTDFAVAADGSFVRIADQRGLRIHPRFTSTGPDLRACAAERGGADAGAGLKGAAEIGGGLKAGLAGNVLHRRFGVAQHCARLEMAAVGQQAKRGLTTGLAAAARQVGGRHAQFSGVVCYAMV